MKKRYAFSYDGLETSIERDIFHEKIKLTRRGFTAGVVAVLTPIGAKTASALNAFTGSGDVEPQSTPRVDAPLNQMNEQEYWMNTQTAWADYAHRTGRLSL